MKSNREHITWNYVSRHFEVDERLRSKLRRKIAKLETHLQRFPTDALHLHVAFERHPRKPQYTVALSLRTPATILHAVKSGRTVIGALDEAVKALLRELVSLKGDLRREFAWKPRRRRQAIRTAGFAVQPQALGSGPQSFDDVMQDFAKRHYPRLLRHVRRQLWHDIRAGELPAGAVDARAVVDEAIARALRTRPHQRPRMDFLLWIHALLRRELTRRRRAWRAQQESVVSLDETHLLPEELDEADGYDAEQPLDIIERQEVPPVTERRDLTPDPAAESPADAMARQDLLGELRRVVSTWPENLRALFELHFVEGFEAGDIALITGREEPQVRDMISTLQSRMRDVVREQAWL